MRFRNQVNRCSKTKGLGDLIFQETQVREVYEFFFIDKMIKAGGHKHQGVENLRRFLSVGVGLMAHP